MYLKKSRAYLLLLLLLALVLGIEGCNRTVEEIQLTAEQVALENLQMVYVRDLPDQDFLILWPKGTKTILDQGEQVRKPLVKEGYALYVKDGDLWLIQLNGSEPQLVAEGELTELDETDWTYVWSPVPGSMDFACSDGGSSYSVYDVWDLECKIGPAWHSGHLAGWDNVGIWRAWWDWENKIWKAQVVDKGGRLIGEQELESEDWKEETEKLTTPPFSKDPLGWAVKPEEIYQVSFLHANLIWAVSRSGDRVELVISQGMKTIETFNGRDASIGPTRDLRP